MGEVVKFRPKPRAFAHNPPVCRGNDLTDDMFDDTDPRFVVPNFMLVDDREVVPEWPRKGST